jgi:hypothetical protein
MLRQILLISIVLACIATGVLFPTQPRFIDCGGNVAALSNVQNLTLIAVQEASSSPSRSFQFVPPPDRWRDILSGLAQPSGARDGKFLVTKTPVTDRDNLHPRLIVVCDTPYRNVPKRRFGLAPPAHAAGYSDGTVRLISTEEFAALPRNEFINL